MSFDFTLQKPFFAAVLLHLVLGFFLWSSASNQTPVMQEAVRNEDGRDLPIISLDQPKPEIVRAVNFDAKEVMDTVNKIKEEREATRQEEIQRQQSLKKQAEQAKQQRIAEQAHLIKLKEEANKLALDQKKQMEAEQAGLKKLAEQKALEAKKLEALKKKQVELTQMQEREAAKLEAIKLKQKQQKTEAERARKAATEAELAAQKQAALERSALLAENQAKMAGEVNKYTALILNAIGARWIIPDNANKNLSSQFRIRLAPDGAVLEVSLLRSSGDTILDRSAQTAIYKASPLPVPTDAKIFNVFRDINLTVRPMNVRG